MTDKELMIRIAGHLGSEYKKDATRFADAAPKGGDIADILRTALSLTSDTFGVIGGIYAIIHYLKTRKDDFENRLKRLSDIVTALPPAERDLGTKILEAARVEMSTNRDE